MAVIELNELSDALIRGEAGIWFPREGDAPTLRFPELGHDACFRIEDTSFWFQHRNACIAAALARHPFAGPLLDVGGGNGAVSRALVDRGLSVVMVEPAVDGAKNARARGVDNVVCSSLDDASFAAGAFGAAGLFDVLEHMEDERAILTSVRRVLKDRGVFAVTVPAYPFLWSAEDEHAMHCRRYTLSRLREVLEATGFVVRYETYFFAALVPPVLVFRALRHRLSRRAAGSVAEAAAKQHAPSEPSRRIMQRLVGPEVARISRGKSVPFGTSCLMIATAGD